MKKAVRLSSEHRDHEAKKDVLGRKLNLKKKKKEKTFSDVLLKSWQDNIDSYDSTGKYKLLSCNCPCFTVEPLRESSPLFGKVNHACSIQNTITKQVVKQ